MEQPTLRPFPGEIPKSQLQGLALAHPVVVRGQPDVPPGRLIAKRVPQQLVRKGIAAASTALPDVIEKRFHTPAEQAWRIRLEDL
ncbi:hypothetical protein HFO10_27190 [Rhizobium laguerreae]|uniref:hypothetical protein n=1 Tax=Rhizobium laguerreae TaxID=1076926 RepID=UPI001C90C2A2|nr:hypothetical protein [Rhizobium laguerreae]MBY3299560.1 hypothetical protein [Rhizobium laguerreae]MBY3543270.1 hypothetical protein [Rhizobium laguerreae]